MDCSSNMADKPVHHCLYCDKKNYKEFRYLREHVVKSHPQNLSDLKNRYAGKKKFNFKCDLCNGNFNKLYHLRYHMKKQHNVKLSADSPRRSAMVKCKICDSVFFKSAMKQHFESFHDIFLQVESFQFENREAFSAWKQKIERETGSRYVSNTRGPDSRYGNCTRRIFSCHRSGMYQSKSTGLRELKIYGSIKINGFCPAEMKVVEREGLINVTYIGTHVGHTQHLGHLYHQDAQHKIFAEEIINEIHFDVISDDSVPGSSSETENQSLHNDDKGHEKTKLLVKTVSHPQTSPLTQQRLEIENTLQTLQHDLQNMTMEEMDEVQKTLKSLGPKLRAIKSARDASLPSCSLEPAN